MLLHRILVGMSYIQVTMLAVPLSAQEFPITPDPMPTARPARDAPPAGRLAESLAGEVGQRQTAATTASIAKPTDRIDNRVRNRVQNRIRNRIDQYYDPKANTTSPFEIAEEDIRQTRPR